MVMNKVPLGRAMLQNAHLSGWLSKATHKTSEADETEKSTDEDSIFYHVGNPILITYILSIHTHIHVQFLLRPLLPRLTNHRT